MKNQNQFIISRKIRGPTGPLFVATAVIEGPTGPAEGQQPLTPHPFQNNPKYFQNILEPYIAIPIYGHTHI